MIDADKAGGIVGIASAGQALRDPAMPIPAAIMRLTRIGDADVAGKAIDLDRLASGAAGGKLRQAGHQGEHDVEVFAPWLSA
ncbi:hypothetical protein M9979_15785 [Sphingomonas sp. RP10(2022)]|uniref:Uncharacterized protein n=1 Tax=Sphingomonas liriopis TaxID=2949094 RepID=A0A9X2KRT5_9SPHN|nr:hypothetical protein [Sphingomonas liriopis]MCP3736330.1 hypothetical protein [Sphingomonas liriopis]